jgi:steroid delta-isomerase-like uncharacterized protein
MSAVFASATNTAQPAPSQQEVNKAVARRVFDEILSQGRFDVADEIYARDFANHGLHRNFNLEEDQAAARWEKQVAPDMKLTVDLMLADGDFVTAVWTARGTNTARVGWLPATGAKFEVRGLTVWRIADGKIHDEWTSFDMLHIVRQIVTQMKWQLMGLLFLVVVLMWMVVRFFRRKFALRP